MQKWSMQKYGLDLSVDEIRGGTLQQLHARLVREQEKFLTGGELEKTVDLLIRSNKDTESLRKAFNERFGTKLVARDFEVQVETGDKDSGASGLRSLPIRLSRCATFCFAGTAGVIAMELTDLEQFVLIQIFDQSWKDHLYAMDVLKAGIGLLAFAEQDPRVQYKKEGFRYFQEMMASVRDKVTDLIFRARVVGATQARNAYRETAAVHNAEQAAMAWAKPWRRRNPASRAKCRKPPINSRARRPRSKPSSAIRRRWGGTIIPCGSGKKYKNAIRGCGLRMI